MIVARRHVENVADLSEDEALDLALVQRAAERALLDVTGTDRAILLKLGIQVPHLHIHIYPVQSTMTRADVMSVIDAKVSELREPGFAAAVTERLKALTPPPL
jgi:diadenosine tetraphosphate (Ap4A) HIT family hydrolase